MKHKCPVCFNPAFYERSMYEICSKCHWEDDGSDKDSEGSFGPNHMSISQYRKKYKGKK
jgi:ribosomal protein L37AE/L43A